MQQKPGKAPAWWATWLVCRLYLHCPGVLYSCYTVVSKSHANWLPATNVSRFVRFVSIRLNQVKSTTFLTHAILSRGAIFSKSHANWLPACWINSRGKDLCQFDRIDNIFNPPSKPRSAIFSKSGWNSIEEGWRIDFRLVESQTPKTNRL